MNRPVTSPLSAFANPTAVRRTLAEILYRGGASHLGSSMSAVEILLAMYGAVDLAKIKAGDPNRDRIIIGKGHCAAAVYAVMHHAGLIDKETLMTYHRDGSHLEGHVSHAAPCVEHSTGALGHGLSVAVGCALGLRARGNKDALVLTLFGDGEMQEGSVWEAVMLAHHQKLDNLIMILDNNRISSITRTDDVLDLRPVRSRFEGFGLAVREVDGHDMAALGGAIAELRGGGSAGVIIANTIKGKGIPFAENEPIWHYRPLNDDTYAQAVAALEGRA